MINLLFIFKMDFYNVKKYYGITALRHYGIIPRLNRGFTLIEILIVTAIIGFLTILAWPSYGHYQKRQKMAEIFRVIEPCKVLIEASHSQEQITTQEYQEPTCTFSTPLPNSPAEYALSLWPTKITISIQNEAITGESGKTQIMLFPYSLNVDGQAQDIATLDEGKHKKHSIHGWACIHPYYPHHGLPKFNYLPKGCLDIEYPKSFEEYYNLIDEKIINEK